MVNMHWTILSEGKLKSNGHRSLRCQCICGTIRDVDIYFFKYNCSKSCGCWQCDILSAINYRAS